MIVEQKQRKRSGCFTFVMVMGIIFLVLLAIFTIVFFIIRGNYFSWEAEFEKGKMDSDYTVISGDVGEILEARVLEKIGDYAESTELVDFIEFNKHETAYIWGSSIQSSLPDGFSIEKIYVLPSKGVWDFFIKLRFGDILLPWCLVRIEKDDIETAQVFISRIEVGGVDIEDLGLKSVRDELNSGVSEALVLIGGNDFTGRSFDNIELEFDSVIIKGRINGIR